MGRAYLRTTYATDSTIVGTGKMKLMLPAFPTAIFLRDLCAKIGNGALHIASVVMEYLIVKMAVMKSDACALPNTDPAIMDNAYTRAIGAMVSHTAKTVVMNCRDVLQFAPLEIRDVLKTTYAFLLLYFATAFMTVPMDQTKWAVEVSSIFI